MTTDAAAYLDALKREKDGYDNRAKVAKEAGDAEAEKVATDRAKQVAAEIARVKRAGRVSKGESGKAVAPEDVVEEA